MNHKRSMTNRVLAMLLSLVLCLSLVPQTVFATSDVSGGAAACVTVKDGAKTAYEVAAGGLLTVQGHHRRGEERPEPRCGGRSRYAL